MPGRWKWQADMSADSIYPAGMTDMLESIAADSARLRTIVGFLPSSDQRLVEQLIGHFDWVLTDLADRPGMLTGEMPWWQRWLHQTDS